MQSILPHFPFSEISIHGYFNVHLRLWITFRFTDPLGEEALTLSILNDLKHGPGPSERAEDITDVILSTMKLSRLHFSLSNVNKTWYNHSYFTSIHKKD